MIDTLTRVLQEPRRVGRFLRFKGIEWYVNAFNALNDLRPRRSDRSLPDLMELHEILEHSRERTDINEHLVTLFCESLALNSSLIVELGVRGGESTFVLERVARLSGATLVSVDVDDCGQLTTFDRWFFVQADDVAFAREFADWCLDKGIRPRVDILFIDTSHYFEHTIDEMRSWLPLMSSRSKVFMHDTNMREIYRRKDGSRGHGWNSGRGVIRALETYFGQQYDEAADFADYRDGWLIRHHAHCNGFTILERLDGLCRPSTKTAGSHSLAAK